MHRVGGVVRDNFEEVAFGDGSYIEVVEKQLTECGSWNRPEIGWHAGNEILSAVKFRTIDFKGQRDVGVRVPAHEIDQALNILGEVLGIDRHGVARFILDVVRHNESKVPNILPMSWWSDSFVLDKFDFESIGDRNQISWG